MEEVVVEFEVVLRVGLVQGVTLEDLNKPGTMPDQRAASWYYGYNGFNRRHYFGTN